jgi:hypothetical protein
MDMISGKFIIIFFCQFYNMSFDLRLLIKDPFGIFKLFWRSSGNLGTHRHHIWKRVRDVARYKMKCRHNLRRGVWGPLKTPSNVGPGFRGGRPQRKTILSVNRCTNGEIWTIKDMKYILILSWNQYIYRSC